MGQTISNPRTVSRRIIEQVHSWPGVEVAHGVRGELSIRFGRKELGHLHGDRIAHFGFPKPLWFELYEQGRIDYHPVFPGKPGWGQRWIDGDDDVREVIALLRLNYDRAAARSPSSGRETPSS
jgi:hypothetical protein